MSDQKLNEIIKALAYGETPEQAAAAEGVDLADAERIQCEHVAEVEEERDMLRKAGYIS